MLPVIHAHVAVDVEEAQGRAVDVDAALGERAAEGGGTAGGGKTRELAAQRLDLGRAIQAEDAAQIRG